MRAPLAVDTNAYVEILRRSAHGARLLEFLSRERSRVSVLTPVVSELLQGAPNAAAQRQIVATLLEAVPPGRRVTPTLDEWLDTGRALARMAAAGHDPAELLRRSFYLDVHIAVLCRKRGVTLITADRDHARIRPHVGHTVEPYPA